MVLLVPPLPNLKADAISVFYVVDELLARSPILIYYGPSASTSSTTTALNSRIQCHIFSAAGLVSYPRLAVNPNSLLYSAVNCLPVEDQGDDICRGLAFSIYKYFAELPPSIKTVWSSLSTTKVRSASGSGSSSISSSVSSTSSLSSTNSRTTSPPLFSDEHAALLASRTVKLDNAPGFIHDVQQSLAEQSLSWMDTDVILPSHTFKCISNSRGLRDSIDSVDENWGTIRYGEYAKVMQLFGNVTFVPSSRLRRAPSRSTLNNTNLFTRRQKECLRREMCELLDTEVSYVGKLNHLVNDIAADFRGKAKSKHTMSHSPNEEALKCLFPPSLDEILRVNTHFLLDVRSIVEETENVAIDDIKTTPEHDPTIYTKPSNDSTAVDDVTGAYRLAQCLVKDFPIFRDSYESYISAHGNFTSYLKLFLNDHSSSFSKRVRDTGEQQLMSMLIEPVQRLPRYTLYIDNILRQLPKRHPAVKLFLKARDIISDICSRDIDADSALNGAIKHLVQHVPNLPEEFPAKGRFVTAMDVVAVPAPYIVDTNKPGVPTQKAILLLFSDVLMELRRTSQNGINASTLKARLENPNVVLAPDSNENGATTCFEYVFAARLSSLDIIELDKGKMIQISGGGVGIGTNDSLIDTAFSDLRVFLLTGSYEGRASRFIEEVTRARIEWRFPEIERCGPAWEARNVYSQDLNLLSAMFEQSSKPIELRSPPAKIRVIIDPEKQGVIDRNDANGVEISAFITRLSDTDYFKLEVRGHGRNIVSQDHLRSSELVAVLVKRITNIVQLNRQIRTCLPDKVLPLLLRNQSILQSLHVHHPSTSDDMDSDHKATGKLTGFRPSSPVKAAITNFFTGTIRESGSKKGHRSVPNMPSSDIPRLLALSTFSTSKDSTNIDRAAPSFSLKKDPSVPQSSHHETNLISRLEATLSSFCLALRVRIGNIVGRSIQNRLTVHEDSVKDLYNALLLDHSNHQLAAQCAVDVLFAAFERFIRIAWFEIFGPIVTTEFLDKLNDLIATNRSANSLNTSAFQAAAHQHISPANFKALVNLMGLLIELLQGMANDHDRNILVSFFTHLLIPPLPSPDKLDDICQIFHHLIQSVDFTVLDPPPADPQVRHSSQFKNMNSLSSNTSLRKRFGFGLASLTRENSRNDHHHHQTSSHDYGTLSSVWRSLSKTKYGSISSVHVDPSDSAAHTFHKNSSGQPTSTNPGGSALVIHNSKSISENILDDPRSSAVVDHYPESTGRTSQLSSASVADQTFRLPVHMVRPSKQSLIKPKKFASNSKIIQSSAPKNLPSDSLPSQSDELENRATPKWDDDATYASFKGYTLSHPSEVSTSVAALIDIVNSQAIPKLDTSTLTLHPSSGSNQPIRSHSASPSRTEASLRKENISSASKSKFAPMSLLPRPPPSHARGGLPTNCNQSPGHPDINHDSVVRDNSGGQRVGKPCIQRYNKRQSACDSESPVKTSNHEGMRSAISSANESKLSNSEPLDHSQRQVHQSHANSHSTNPGFIHMVDHSTVLEPTLRTSSRLSYIKKSGFSSKEDPTELQDRENSESSLTLLAPSPHTNRNSLTSSHHDNFHDLAKSTFNSPHKLKAFNAERLRERLVTEQANLSNTKQCLEQELADVTSEMKRLTSYKDSSLPTVAINTPKAVQMKKLEARISALETRVRSATSPIQKALASLSNDYSSSLQVTEAKFKKIDQMYREAIIENEILYSRFNEELERLYQEFNSSIAANKDVSTAEDKISVRRQEEFKRRQHLHDENIKLRKENARLHRELGIMKVHFR